MPVYNEEEYIAFAIESVITQVTDFPFILLIIDDASDDRTMDIVKEYEAIVNDERNGYACKIMSVCQKRNRGKAYSMYTAYTMLKQYQEGGYFIILDGDDFFTVRTKLQAQVDFLEDNPGYIGCGHEFIIERQDTTPLMYITGQYRKSPDYAPMFERGIHSIEDWPTMFYYSHTSTMMYRNIFSSIEVPSYFAKPSMRGDSALMLWFFITTGKRIGHLNMIGSCYNVHGKGIWTGIAIEDKIALTEDMFDRLCVLTANEMYIEKMQEIKEVFIQNIVYEKEIMIPLEKECILLYTLITRVIATLSHIGGGGG